MNIEKLLKIVIAVLASIVVVSVVALGAVIVYHMQNMDIVEESEIVEYLEFLDDENNSDLNEILSEVIDLYTYEEVTTQYNNTEIPAPYFTIDTFEMNYSLLDQNRARLYHNVLVRSSMPVEYNVQVDFVIYNNDGHILMSFPGDRIRSGETLSRSSRERPLRTDDGTPSHGSITISGRGIQDEIHHFKFHNGVAFLEHDPSYIGMTSVTNSQEKDPISITQADLNFLDEYIQTFFRISRELDVAITNNDLNAIAALGDVAWQNFLLLDNQIEYWESIDADINLRLAGLAIAEAFALFKLWTDEILFYINTGVATPSLNLGADTLVAFERGLDIFSGLRAS